MWNRHSGVRSPATLPRVRRPSASTRLDRILADLAGRDLAAAEVLISVEKPDPGLADLVRERAAALGAGELDVIVDDRDVQNAAPIFSDDIVLPSEVDRFRALVEEDVLPACRVPANPVTVRARLSEPPEVRRQLEAEVRAVAARTRR